MLWQPPCEGQALELHLGEAAEEEEEEEEEEAEDNQLLSLHSNLSPSCRPPKCEPWERFPESSKEKETKPMLS